MFSDLKNDKAFVGVLVPTLVNCPLFACRYSLLVGDYSNLSPLW